MKVSILAMIIGLLLLSGCVKTQIIDKVQTVHGVAFDYIDEDTLLGTMTMPAFNPDGTIDIAIFQEKASSNQSFRMKVNTASPKEVTVGQLRVVLFGKELASKGIMHIVSTLYRNASVGSRVFLAVADGKAGPILKGNYPLQPLTTLYISDTIQQNISTENLPETNLHFFVHHYYDEEKDAYLPIIKKENHKVFIKGLGFFEQGRLVHHINMRETFVFKQMYSDNTAGTFEVFIAKNNRNNTAVVQNVKSSQNIKITYRDGIPHFHFNIGMEGKINEGIKTAKLKNSKMLTKIETKMEKAMEKIGMRLLKEFQNKKVDPLGLGSQLETSKRGFTSEWYDRVYKEATFSMDVKVEITQTGVTS